jgi:hypothetical protein
MLHQQHTAVVLLHVRPGSSRLARAVAEIRDLIVVSLNNAFRFQHNQNQNSFYFITFSFRLQDHIAYR